MNLNAYQRACTVFLLLLVIFWAALFFGNIKGTFYNDFYDFLYALIPLFGGALALIGYRKWGGLSTILGKAILLLGFGLFLWGCGGVTYAYYNIFLHVEIPYPSIADIFYAPSVFFYTLGAIYLSRTTGIGIGWKHKIGKMFAIITPFVLLLIAYYVEVVLGRGGQLVSEHGNVLKTFLDIFYPLGDFISLAVSVVVAGLSFRYLGGRYKADIFFILIGLGMMFVADSYFSYTTTVGTAYNGDFGDLVFMIAMYLLTCGLLGFNKIQEPEAAPAD